MEIANDGKDGEVQARLDREVSDTLHKALENIYVDPEEQKNMRRFVVEALNTIRQEVHIIQETLGSKGGLEVLAKFVNARVHRGTEETPQYYLQVRETSTPQNPSTN